MDIIMKDLSQVNYERVNSLVIKNSKFEFKINKPKNIREFLEASHENLGII